MQYGWHTRNIRETYAQHTAAKLLNLCESAVIPALLVLIVVNARRFTTSACI
jgi:hypothetical protein